MARAKKINGIFLAVLGHIRTAQTTNSSAGTDAQMKMGAYPTTRVARSGPPWALVSADERAIHAATESPSAIGNAEIHRNAFILFAERQR